MSKYTCQLCHKVFNQKIDFTRHAAKKSPCVSIEVIQTMAQTAVAVNDNKAKLSTLFQYCLDVLRNNEHIIGEKALRTLAYLLDLRLLEYQFGKQIDIDGFAYDLSDYDCDVNELKSKLLRVVRFSNLARENEENIPNIMKILWDEILCVHPITRNIFAKGKGFAIKNQSTYKKLIDKLFDFDFDAMDNDILGEAYEEVIKDVMTGKVLGQFFTPPAVKNILVDLVDPQIHKDGTIETIFDPAMGTGGFLITCLRHLQQKAKKNNQPLDWGFITSQGIGGREAEPDTFQLAVSNLLIASGRMFKSLENGDSIRDPITNKYDIILANPPFGISGLTYTEIMHPLRNEYMPISSNSAVPLFLQAIIHMLKIGGRCAVVLPEGQELFSKNNVLVAVRRYLMTTCDLKEVIYLPAGTFTHTSIKTCVFHFHKKKEGKDVMETKVKYSKTTQQETERNYVFHEPHQTSKVGFYDCNPENGVRHLLLEVDIADIANNNYSLNYAEYLRDDTADEIYEGVVVKTLDQIFHITKGTQQSSKNIDGEYTFITASDTNKTHNSFTHDCECVMLVGGAEGSLAKAQYFKGKFIASDLLYVLIRKKENEINYKYAWYYLNFNREKHLADKTICCGTPKKMISKDRCSNIKIPIPSLERQQEIVKNLDLIYEKNIKLEREIEQNKTQAKMLISGILKETE
jgi:type I restriction-modification system DNA methylase subunit